MIPQEKKFKPLPNAYTRDRNWTVDETSERSNVDAFHHTVSAPTHLSDTATLERTRINARAAIGHIKAHDSTIPSWLYQAAFDTKAMMDAHHACDEITEAQPWEMPDAEYLVQNHKWQDIIINWTRAAAANAGGLEPEYRSNYVSEVNQGAYPAKNICHTIAQHIQVAASFIDNTDTYLSNDAVHNLRTAQQLYEMIEEISDSQPPSIGDEPVDTGSTENEYADWDDVVEEIARFTDHYGHGEEGITWSEMTIKVHPLVERIKGFLGKKRKRRLTDAGSALTRPDRIMTDGLCFDAKGDRKDIVGAILIDNSGSMSFDANDVEMLVQAAPGVTIAHYSGSGDRGTLDIVCQNGKRANTDSLRASHGGNGVDGPALQWLAQQPGPRVWVSDGLVTGQYDRTAIHLIHECMTTCNSAAITRVPDIDVLTQWVEAQRSKASGR